MRTSPIQIVDDEQFFGVLTALIFERKFDNLTTSHCSQHCQATGVVDMNHIILYDKTNRVDSITNLKVAIPNYSRYFEGFNMNFTLYLSQLVLYTLSISLDLKTLNWHRTAYREWIGYIDLWEFRAPKLGGVVRRDNSLDPLSSRCLWSRRIHVIIGYLHAAKENIL